MHIQEWYSLTTWVIFLFWPLALLLFFFLGHFPPAGFSVLLASSSVMFCQYKTVVEVVCMKKLTFFTIFFSLTASSTAMYGQYTTIVEVVYIQVLCIILYDYDCHCHHHHFLFFVCV